MFLGLIVCRFRLHCLCHTAIGALVMTLRDLQTVLGAHIFFIIACRHRALDYACSIFLCQWSSLGLWLQYIKFEHASDVLCSQQEWLPVPIKTEHQGLVHALEQLTSIIEAALGSCPI